MRSPRGHPWQVGAVVLTLCSLYTCGPKSGLLTRWSGVPFEFATGAFVKPRRVDPAGGAVFNVSSVKSPARFVAATPAPVVLYGQPLLEGHAPLQDDVRKRQ